MIHNSVSIERHVNNEVSSSLDFTCSICLDDVHQPVVTHCGHLFCRPCIYQWLEPGMSLKERQVLEQRPSYVPPVQGSTRSEVITRAQKAHRLCPLCKARCTLLTLVPVYVQERTPNNDNETAVEDRGPTPASRSSDPALDRLKTELAALQSRLIQFASSAAAAAMISAVADVRAVAPTPTAPPTLPTSVASSERAVTSSPRAASHVRHHASARRRQNRTVTAAVSQASQFPTRHSATSLSIAAGYPVNSTLANEISRRWPPSPVSPRRSVRGGAQNSAHHLASPRSGQTRPALTPPRSGTTNSSSTSSSPRPGRTSQVLSFRLDDARLEPIFPSVAAAPSPFPFRTSQGPAIGVVNHSQSGSSVKTPFMAPNPVSIGASCSAGTSGFAVPRPTSFQATNAAFGGSVQTVTAPFGRSPFATSVTTPPGAVPPRLAMGGGSSGGNMQAATLNQLTQQMSSVTLAYGTVAPMSNTATFCPGLTAEDMVFSIGTYNRKTNKNRPWLRRLRALRRKD